MGMQTTVADIHLHGVQTTGADIRLHGGAKPQEQTSTYMGVQTAGAGADIYLHAGLPTTRVDIQLSGAVNNKSRHLVTWDC